MEVKYDTVYFLHSFKTKFEKHNDYPVLKNNTMDFYKVIKFLGSCQTIVTDSYHGAYWGQLLGKNIHVVSWSVKFNHMKYAPNFLENINQGIPNVKNSITGFLDECRHLNQKFYDKFQNLVQF